MTRRLAVTVVGTVQGVGFRPFVHAVATARGLSGWVRNGASGVRIEIEGSAPDVESFVSALRDPPPSAHVERIDTCEVPALRERGFAILSSTHDDEVLPTLPADLATCADCVAEMDGPRERRHRYAFTNCTRCGPRYSIALSLPYDRPNTSMRDFALCRACSAEYHDPADRRFHAQPIACPSCGPALRLIDPRGDELMSGSCTIAEAARRLARGEILALKGLGGYQLLVDATNEAAVARLRDRKHRAEKPFAVLFESLEAVRSSCRVTELESSVLASPEAPIVLVRKGVASTVADAVAPGDPRLGVMLPATPLHRLLVVEVGRPLVCTSGNLSEESMCITEAEALARLGAVADVFLVHDREIVRPIDDSVGQIGSSGFELLRRARGYAPLPLGIEDRRSIVATGAHLKSTVAISKAGRVVVSQHLGDLSASAAVLLHKRTARDLAASLEVEPEIVACDLHPDYASTRLAERLASARGVPLIRVQHHHAHIAACMAEQRIAGPVLGLAWDGAGLGTDGTIWGGEALVVDGASFRRVAHLRPFSLPGGERAMRAPLRVALGLLYEIFGEDAVAHLALPDESSARTLLSMLRTSACCTRSSSMGRVFDAVAAITGVRTEVTYEGQAAMALEHMADGVNDHDGYPILLREGEPSVADWEPMLRAILYDRARGVGAAIISARFHNGLAALAESIASRIGLERVVLSGGCFQNQRLAGLVRERLSARGFDVFTPRLYPPNDGGISLGQLFVAACRKDVGDVPRHPG